MQGEDAHEGAVKVEQGRKVHDDMLGLLAHVGEGTRVAEHGLAGMQHFVTDGLAGFVIVEELADGEAKVIFGVPVASPEIEHELVDEGDLAVGVADGEGGGHAAHEAFADPQLFLDDG